MNLDKLYKLQAELDNHILTKHKILEKMTKEELLNNTILALLVEVGELANATRCFKHWSTKGMMEKEIVLDELADVLHFYLSVGNQVNMRWEKGLTNVEEMEWFKSMNTTTLIHNVYYWAVKITSNISIYNYVGDSIYKLAINLGFTDQEVEQAYLKKHEENYRRQEEGY